MARILPVRAQSSSNVYFSRIFNDYRSVRPSIGQMLINVDVSVSAMYVFPSLSSLTTLHICFQVWRWPTVGHRPRCSGKSKPPRSRNARGSRYVQETQKFSEELVCVGHSNGGTTQRKKPQEEDPWPRFKRWFFRIRKKRSAYDCRSMTYFSLFIQMFLINHAQTHFKDAHAHQLRQPNIFGILVGSKERAIVFPAEVCTVVEGQIYKKVSVETVSSCE